MPIRRLNDKEKKAWPKIAEDFDKSLNGMTKRQLLAAFETAKSAAEQAEIPCLVIEKRLRALGYEEYLNPMPARKAAEAVRLAFPKFEPRVATLG